ncbi:ankyrin [Colletotrichum sublineola]|nr:ankyrin [Colletotrichum sublineola]
MVVLLLEQGASPSDRKDTDTTPFYRAARNGLIEVLSSLYEAGSELDARTWDRRTPLMKAVDNGNRGAVELLLSRGANSKSVSRYGITQLYLASEDLAPLTLEAFASRVTDR